MRHLVVVLAIVSATLAGTTVYFARELQLERERPKAALLPMTVVTSVVPARTTTAGGPHAPQLVQQVPKAPVVTETEKQQLRKLHAEQAGRILKTLGDPEQREGMLFEYKMTMRNSYPRVAQAIGLSNDEAERLFMLLAQQQIEMQDRHARCMADLDCNTPDGNAQQVDPRDQEIAELLGPQRQQEFETYKNSLMERESVTQLLNRLPDANRLSDTKAEALIAVLADERQRIHVEAAQRGSGMNGYGTGVGMVFSAVDATTPDERMESALANSRRMHNRAEEVLNAEQLRVFDAMQDELLISMRNQLRRKEESAPGSSVATATVAN